MPHEHYDKQIELLLVDEGDDRMDWMTGDQMRFNSWPSSASLRSGRGGLAARLSFNFAYRPIINPGHK